MNDINVKPKSKAHEGFVGKNVILCPNLYFYHDKAKRDDLMWEFSLAFGPYTYEIIVKVPIIKINLFKLMIEYDTAKEVAYGIYFCDIFIEFPGIIPVKIF